MSLDCHPVEDAILIRDGTPAPEQLAFAARLAADPDYTIVICDLAEEYAEQAWDPVVQALAATAGNLRLVPWRQHAASLLPVGELLCHRLARVVVAADGHPVMSAGGGLFVPPGAGTGWYRMGPGRMPRLDSRRFPRPRWTAWAPLEDTVALSPATTLHPLPSGAWLSPGNTAPVRGDHGERDHSRWLYGHIAWSHDTINVVLGQPGAPTVPADDIARLWATLPVKARQCVQFVPYGTAGPSRQELAAALGDRVTMAPPLPGAPGRGSGPAEDAATGQPGTDTSVMARPAAAPSAEAPSAEATGAKIPGAEVPGAAVTVAASRSAAPPPHSERQRLPAIRLESGPLSSARQPGSAAPGELTRSTATPPRVAAEGQGQPATVRDDEKEADAAAQLAARAGDARASFAPGPVSAAPPAPDPAPVPVPPLSGASSAEEPAPAASAEDAGPAAVPGAAAPAGTARTGGGPVRVQPVPGPDASAVYLGGGLEQERQWLQRSLSRQFSAAASSVARVLSQNPRLRGGGGPEVVADLVAARLYLTEYGQFIDDRVRAGQPGTHVPFARCVNAGLRRLPSQRGAVRLRATLSAAERDWYASQRLITEWSFCPGLTDGTVPLAGDVSFLIWSATARRTAALAPEVPGQVVFLPGARFKVLAVRDGEQPEVLLREIPASETAPGAPPGTEPAPLDEIALAGLGQASAAWAALRQDAELPPQHARRFGHPPGLIHGPAGDQVT